MTEYYSKERKKNRKRLEKLRQKAQKAKVVEKLSEITLLPSWNKRFRKVSSLKFLKAEI